MTSKPGEIKTCSRCRKSYPLSRVICLECKEILEEPFYIRLIMLTLGAAFALHLVLGKMGYPGRGLVRETLMTEAALLIFSVLIWKGLQKWRSPQRRILYELASLYTDRIGRIVIFICAAVLILSFSGLFTAHAPRKVAEPDLLHTVRSVRAWLLLGFGSVYLIVVFYVQGLDFFNLSLENSFIPKERRRAENGS